MLARQTAPSAGIMPGLGGCSMLRRNCALVGFVAGILTVSAPVARAADHLDGPRLMANDALRKISFALYFCSLRMLSA